MPFVEIPSLSFTNRPSFNSNDNFSYNQPRNLPNWLWITITKSLGIKLQNDEKPIVSCILFVITLTSSFGLAISEWWFTTYDIMSNYTKTSVISGSIGILYKIFWVALGIYANNLAYRLYRHPHFFKLVKLHSKTIFKMNAALILFFLMVVFILINNINGFGSFRNKTCETVGLSSIVCKFRFISRLIFSICTLLWNYLVAFAMTSICRSHVLRIRKFMKILEEDSKVYEARFLGIVNNEIQPLEDYFWEEENYSSELKDEDDDICRSTPNLSACSTTIPDIDAFVPSSTVIQDSPQLAATAVEQQDIKSVLPSLTNDEILFNYWKIQVDLRKSSVALQRWMMSLISLVAIWLAMNLASWLNNEPNAVDLANFVLPILLLPLLTSAYAEVNQEGHRLLKYICLLDNRIQLLLLLQATPLQMTVYSYSLSYSTIGTASFGVLIAMSSKILLQEMFGK